jgi:hypothetical protein
MSFDAIYVDKVLFFVRVRRFLLSTTYDTIFPLTLLALSGKNSTETEPPHKEGKGEGVIRARILKLLWSPGIASKEPIPPVYVAWRAGTIASFLLGS